MPETLSTARNAPSAVTALAQKGAFCFLPLRAGALPFERAGCPGMPRLLLTRALFTRPIGAGAARAGHDIAGKQIYLPESQVNRPPGRYPPAVTAGDLPVPERDLIDATLF